MADSKAKRSIYNVVFGVLSQVITIALGIVIPRMFLVSYGSEMNGLLNSVSQLYVYMGLLEAGLGTITLQALYGPVGRNDHDGINRVLSAANQYYRKIGIFYVLGIFLLAVLYPLVVPSEIPFWIISGIIFLNGISGAITFLFQKKYKLLLDTEGKSYIETNISLIIHVATSFSKIILIMLGAHILVIQAVYAALNLLHILYIAAYIKKHYKWIDLSVQPDYSSMGQRNSAFVHQIASLIFHNTDVLVLTLVPGCGLLVVSVYTLYNLLYNMVDTLINTVISGISFILGQTFNTDRKRHLIYHDIYEVYGIAVTFALFTVVYIFILPFLELYTVGISDINYIDEALPVLFTLVFLLKVGRYASVSVINYAKHFKQTQSRAILEAAINVVVSFACSFWFGIYGVLCGTIAALLYRTNDIIIYSNHVILKRSCLPTYYRWLSNFVVFGVVVYVAGLIPMDLSSYGKIILWAALTAVIVVPLYLVIASLLNRNVYRNAIGALVSLIKNRESRR